MWHLCLSFFHWASSQGSAVLQYVSIFDSFLQLSNILLCGHTPFCLSIHQVMDFWVIATVWLLWVMSLWTFAHRFLCGYVVSFLLGVGPRISIAWSRGNPKFNILRNFRIVFPSNGTILHSHSFFFLFFKFLKIFIFIYLALGLSFGRWDLVPQPGIKHRSPHSECRVLAIGPPGKSLFSQS